LKLRVHRARHGHASNGAGQGFRDQQAALHRAGLPARLKALPLPVLVVVTVPELLMLPSAPTKRLKALPPPARMVVDAGRIADAAVAADEKTPRLNGQKGSFPPINHPL
jgi:hypothetical protein